jgi:hypothetical protein
MCIVGTAIQIGQEMLQAKQKGRQVSLPPLLFWPLGAA